jgi:hypothetical protein
MVVVQGDGMPYGVIDQCKGDGNRFAGTDLASKARILVPEMGGRAVPIGEPVEVHEEVGLAITAALLPVLRRIAVLDVANGARSVSSVRSGGMSA